MKTKIFILLMFCVLKPCGASLAESGYMTYYTAESCRSEGNSGIYTASGDRFDEKALTCARRSREWGKKWYVYCPSTGKSLVVTQNDFGPGKGPTRKGVIINLTPAGFKALGVDTNQGRAKVCIQEIL